MKEHFYDIESLSNVFTLCNFRSEDNCIEVYYLCDTPNLVADPQFADKLLKVVHAKNKNFNGAIELFDLGTEVGCHVLARTFGLSDAYIVNDERNPGNYPIEFRPVCDTDDNYDENKHPYLFGYNSYNYDTTMLAEFLYETFFIRQEQVTFTPVTAKKMRDFNDSLFTEMFKKSMPQALTRTFDPVTKRFSEPDFQDPRWRIRKNMMLTGRHLDVARLNEKQSKVGLKRLLGMLGHQILESDKLGAGVDHIDTVDQLYELIAYNVSDVVNLRELFHHKFYQGQFSLKRGLLKTYPELIYEQDGETYKPKCHRHYVRRDRLTIDSSSAQFATKALCPYGHLKDIPTVSYLYPSDRKIKELAAQGKVVKQVNVLEETKKFFFNKFPQPELRAQFMKVYNYYKKIEGQNFNDSDNYRNDYGDANGNLPANLAPHLLSQVEKDENCMPYYDADGKPSSCFVTFSTGGIHGAEYNVDRFVGDMQEWRLSMALMKAARDQYPDPLALREAKKVTIGGVEYSYTKFLKSGCTLKAMRALSVPERTAKFFRDVESDKPVLFKPTKDGATKLNPKYVFTSADLTNHEDFTSYYPNMLRMMSAFWNPGLGVDRYGEIFDNKTRYGILQKDKSLSQEERDLYSVQREGTKLVLNSASGAGDTKGEYRSPIQMNNRIISMRIIGQLFTYRIGQAQTFEGAKITSTNTDGLYSVMEATVNNKILARESDDIGVEIEPEPTFLVSKDSNNRLEMDSTTGEIQSASGSSLACRDDTNPTKALAHPAILDWALTEYLVVAATGYKGMSLTKPFDHEIGRSILANAVNVFEKPHLLRMYQNVLASSTGSISYIFGLRDNTPGVPVVMQHYNRVFIVTDSKPDTIHLHSANAKAITDAMKKKRARDHERAIQHDPLAMQVLNANGVKPSDLPRNKEAVLTKVTNIEPEWNMLIENRSLNLMTDAELDAIYSRLDMDKYLGLLADSFEKNWRNQIPEHIITDEEIAATITDPVTFSEHGDNDTDQQIPENVSQAQIDEMAVVKEIFKDTDENIEPLQETQTPESYPTIITGPDGTVLNDIALTPDQYQQILAIINKQGELNND